jgi:hypothetical protein
MSLSSLNPTPLYETKLPSTGKKVSFRPFFVKEERALLAAYESEDIPTMLTTLNMVVNACMTVPAKLAIFDIEYMFLQIRAKSVEEFSRLVMMCEGCGEETTLSIDIRTAVVENLAADKTIKLSDTLSVKMKYPTLDDVVAIHEMNDPTQVESRAIISSIDTIFTASESLKVSDEPIEDIIQFIDKLTGKQFALLKEFIQNVPTVSVNSDWTCPKCKHENKKTIRGIHNCFA